jgi:predicted ArsR family transcriptional regulator
MLVEDEDVEEFLRKEDQIKEKLRKEGPLNYIELKEQTELNGTLIRNILQDLLNKGEIRSTSDRKFDTI